jgi:hypothetical protein
MPKELPDLIPNEFGESEVMPPVRILRAQQESIPKKTNGLIEAMIKTSSEGDVFYHFFYLTVPSLDDYTYLVLTVSHPIHFYPLQVRSFTGERTECADEVSYINALAETFRSDQFKRIMNSLIEQAKEVPT